MRKWFKNKIVTPSLVVTSNECYVKDTVAENDPIT